MSLETMDLTKISKIGSKKSLIVLEQVLPHRISREIHYPNDSKRNNAQSNAERNNSNKVITIN
jgi:hypothetical protein